jgi:serine/threonine-protein kinase
MAEVYLGHADGPGGFSKAVVIKRILPELAEDPAFVEMFLSEAKLAAQLSHPNVVQVFDFGEHAGQYYLAMEYIRGETLRTIGKMHLRLNKVLPAEWVVRAVIGVCEGLHYAHELCDEEGESRHIIHRDVTPDNILISSGGVPKLLDFGIAKAATNVHRTAAGTVKGKYAYMSPELIRGEDVGRQLDVYALGVTLYELLARKRPFESPTEMGLMKNILEGTAKPLHELGIDRDLSLITATAMAAQPEGRYADAHELQLALEEWLDNTGKKVGSAELAAVVAEVTRAKSGVSATGLPAVKGTPGSGIRHTSEPKPALLNPDGTPKPRASSPGVRHLGSEPKPVVMGTLLEAPPLPVDVTVARPYIPDASVAPASSRKGLFLAIGGAVLLLAIGAAGSHLLGGPSQPQVVVVQELAPPPAPLPVPPPPPAKTVVTVQLPEPAPAPVLVAAAAAGKAKPVDSAIKGEDGYLTLRTDPWCDVYLGNEKLGTTPLVRAPVPSGKLTLVLRNAKAGANRRLAVTVEPGLEAKQTLVMPQGSLEVEAKDGTEVALDGQPLGTTPLEPQDVVEGRHEIRLGGVTKVVKIRAGKTERVAP